jgi:hypothetical protein
VGDEDPLTLPSKERLENLISIDIEGKMDLCLDGFQEFSDFEVNSGEIEADSVIESERVVIGVKYPLDIKKGGRTYSLEDFDVEIPVRLGIFYETAKNMSRFYSNGELCVNCIADFASENDVYVDALDYNEGAIMFIITDDDSKINNERFEFIFAMRK